VHTEKKHFSAKINVCEAGPKTTLPERDYFGITNIRTD
jgi:hypothetical protein